MSTTYPIKNEEALEKFKNYYLKVKPNYRNYALVILGLNTAFRIGDLLKLRWADIYNRKEQHFREHISRSQAYRIIKEAGMSTGLDENISCHSLRKTFGYHTWKQGVQPAILMDIYNHSSYRITRRYLGIEQDDRDNVYLNIKL